MKEKNMFNLKNRTAIVTGGGGILGRRFSNILSEYGANVAVFDVDIENANLTVSEIKKNNPNSNLIAFSCDVSIPESVQEAVEKVNKIFGSIDILSNNAATKTNNLKNFLNSFEDYDLETWREVMSVNIDGMFLMAQAVGKKMLTQPNGGCIVQTASIYGVLAPDQRIYEGSKYLGQQISSPAVYAASKAAVIGLSKYLASYWGDKNIRVNTISPGGVESGQNDKFRNNYSSRVPMRRMAELNEIESALLFLASDSSSYITGQNLIIDGGLSSW